MNALPKIRHTHVLCFIVLERFFLWFRFLGRRGSVRLGTFLLAFAATSISPDVISFQVFGAHTVTVKAQVSFVVLVVFVVAIASFPRRDPITSREPRRWASN
jgi:hypothetical protein